MLPCQASNESRAKSTKACVRVCQQRSRTQRPKRSIAPVVRPQNGQNRVSGLHTGAETIKGAADLTGVLRDGRVDSQPGEEGGNQFGDPEV